MRYDLSRVYEHALSTSTRKESVNDSIAGSYLVVDDERNIRKNQALMVEYVENRFPKLTPLFREKWRAVYCVSLSPRHCTVQGAMGF